MEDEKFHVIIHTYHALKGFSDVNSIIKTVIQHIEFKRGKLSSGFTISS